MTTEPSWTGRLKTEVPIPQRAAFLTDLQALVASLRNDQEPAVTNLLRSHSELALTYMDDGPKKDRARVALAGRKP